MGHYPLDMQCGVPNTFLTLNQLLSLKSLVQDFWFILINKPLKLV